MLGDVAFVGVTCLVCGCGGGFGCCCCGLSGFVLLFVVVVYVSALFFWCCIGCGELFVLVLLIVSGKEYTVWVWV